MVKNIKILQNKLKVKNIGRLLHQHAEENVKKIENNVRKNKTHNKKLDNKNRKFHIQVQKNNLIQVPQNHLLFILKNREIIKNIQQYLYTGA